MKIAVAYCFPCVQTQTYLPLARQFALTWRQFPSGKTAHSFHVVFNGHPTPLEISVFHGYPCQFHVRDNYGWDIGAYLQLSETVPCDLLVCLGAHIRFHHAGWLDQAVNAVIEHGPGLYGPWGARYPTPHIRTTAFWCPPPLLSSYPHAVTSQRQSRYRFEHGRDSFTAHAASLGFPTIMVTRRGCYDQPDWNGHEPDREDSLILDKQHA